MKMFDPLLKFEFLFCHSLILALLCHLNSVTIFMKIFKILKWCEYHYKICMIVSNLSNNWNW